MPRIIFTFRCSALDARSRNYAICISYGKNLSKRCLIRKFQPTNFNSKPKEKIKYISNGKKYLNSGENLSCTDLFQSNCDIFLLSTIFSFVARSMMLKSAYSLWVLKIQNKEVNDVNAVSLSLWGRSFSSFPEERCLSTQAGPSVKETAYHIGHWQSQKYRRHISSLRNR